MIGELTGQILAIIATFEFAAARAGAALQLVVRTVQAGVPRLALATGGTFPAGAVAVDVTFPIAAVGLTAAMVSQEPPGGRHDKPAQETQREETQRERTEPAEIRRVEGRPVGTAFNDAQRARQADVFVQPDGRYVVRGPRGREHIFDPDGTHITTVRRRQSAHQGKVVQGERRLITIKEFERFREMFR